MNSHWKIWILSLSLCLIASPGFFVRAEGEAEDIDSAEEDAEDYADDESTGDLLPPIITTHPRKFPLKEGTQIRLECAGEHFDAYGLIWSHGSEILFAGEQTISPDKRVKAFDNGTLMIENAVKSDTGVYTCKLWDNVTLEHVVFVTSEDDTPGMPYVLVPTPTLIVNKTEPVTLTCHSTGNPEPTVEWRRHGDHTFPNGDKVIKSPVVTFSSVTRHHGGRYECNAQNSVGFATTAMQLEVNFAPEIELVRDSVHSASGSEAELICKVHAEPKPKSVTWTFNGKPIDTKTGHHHAVDTQRHIFTLHLKNVSEDDYGEYECAAENKLGRSSGRIELTGTPSQPVLPPGYGALGDEHMSYRLVWTVESSIPIDDYKLSYRKRDGEWQNVTAKGQLRQNQQYVYEVTHTLNKLISNSDYEVVLSAHNKNGWSKPSRIHTFHINGKNNQSLYYQGSETAKASVVAGGKGGGSCLVSSTSFAWFLVLFTVSFWRRQQ